jgi:hypothetical protein
MRNELMRYKTIAVVNEVVKAKADLNLSMYGTEGMESEDGVVSMEEALRINKELTQKRNHITNLKKTTK